MPAKKKTKKTKPSAAPGPRPSVGRIVHYTRLDGSLSDGYVVCAALITAVDPTGAVALQVFERSHSYGIDIAHQAKAPAGTLDACGKWSWPAQL